MNTTRILEATLFAAQAHSDQRRKGSSGAPYVNHVVQVAALVAQYGGNEESIIAALLHDTVEDTDVSIDQIQQQFGATVASLVAEVTDDKDLPKAERKRLQIENAPLKSTRAKLIKIADKLCNCADLIVDPPPTWSEARQREYFVWGKAVVDRLRGDHPEIESRFDEVYAKGIAQW